MKEQDVRTEFLSSLEMVGGLAAEREKASTVFILTVPRCGQALYTYLLLHVIDETAGRTSRRARHIPAKDPEAPPIFHPYNRVWILPLNLASYSTQQVASVGGKIPKVYLSCPTSDPAAANGLVPGGGVGSDHRTNQEGEGGGAGAAGTKSGKEGVGVPRGAYHLVLFRNGDALWAFLLDPALSAMSGNVLTQLAGDIEGLWCRGMRFIIGRS